MTNATGRGANREASAPAVDEIHVTKLQDGSSTALFKMALWGEGKKCTIDFCKTDHNKLEVFIRVELENALVTKYSLHGDGGVNHDRPMETFSLNFTKITLTTIHMDDKNKTGRPDRATWDLAKAKGA